MNSRARALKGAHETGLPERGASISKTFSSVVAEMEPNHAGVPVLLRPILETRRQSWLGFNVDPAFANALDGLILVDLTKTAPKLLERYLGRNEGRIIS